MSETFRRFEILLPLQFNDGTPVPDTMIVDILLELENRFGVVSSETQIIRGLWQHEDQVFADDSMRVVVDVADMPENREFFRQLKERLKVRFRQVDIWMTTHLIDVV